jgi:hypothetical protein
MSAGSIAHKRIGFERLSLLYYSSSSVIEVHDTFDLYNNIDNGLPANLVAILGFGGGGCLKVHPIKIRGPE